MFRWHGSETRELSTFWCLRCRCLRCRCLGSRLLVLDAAFDIVVARAKASFEATSGTSVIRDASAKPRVLLARDFNATLNINRVVRAKVHRIRYPFAIGCTLAGTGSLSALAFISHVATKYSLRRGCGDARKDECGGEKKDDVAHDGNN